MRRVRDARPAVRIRSAAARLLVHPGEGVARRARQRVVGPARCTELIGAVGGARDANGRLERVGDGPRERSWRRAGRKIEVEGRGALEVAGALDAGVRTVDVRG